MKLIHSMRTAAFLSAILLLAALPAIAKAEADSASLTEISFTSEPTGASVIIDNENCGVTPLTKALSSGEHYIEISSDEYTTKRETITVDSSSPTTYEAQLKKETGIVLIRSKPEGAEVRIDDITLGKTPLLLTDLDISKETPYRAELSLSGHRTATIQFKLIDRVPVLAEAELFSNSATLDLTCSTTAAEISVDGIVRGTTPCVIEDIPTDKDIIIQADAEGYKPFVRITKLNEMQRLKIDIKLEELTSKLNIVSIPDKARVYIDNSFKGETPYTLDNAKAGDYTVRIELPGYDPIRRVVPLSRGEEITEEFRLKENTGKMIVTSKPEGVSVLINDQIFGETKPTDIPGISAPTEIKTIPEGEQTIKFVKSGYETQTITLEVKRGESTSHQIELKKLFIPDYKVITTSGKTVTGMLKAKTPEGIRLETSKGVERTIRNAEIVSHGKLK